MIIMMLLALSQCVFSQILEPRMIELLDEYNNASILLCNAQAKANWDVQT